MVIPDNIPKNIFLFLNPPKTAENVSALIMQKLGDSPLQFDGRARGDVGGQRHHNSQTKRRVISIDAIPGLLRPLPPHTQEPHRDHRQLAAG